MPALLPYARLLAVAALCSLTLTSCFDRGKKCDPQPARYPAGQPAPTATPTPGR